MNVESQTASAGECMQRTNANTTKNQMGELGGTETIGMRNPN